MSQPKKPDETEREFIEYRFNELREKLDSIQKTVNGFAFAKQSELDKTNQKLEIFKDNVDKTYVKKESLRWIQYTLGGITVGVGVALIIAVFKILGANI